MADPSTSYRNPYTIGGWVSGQRFYGHADLRQYILLGSDNYIWVIGTRRVGKTSLLRQLHVQGRKDYLPIYWDMQGCATAADLRDELVFALEDQMPMLEKLGIRMDTLVQEDMANVLRRVCRQAEKHEMRVLLLIDEPEPLITIARQEPRAIQRLRAAFQRPPNLRVVLASTKSLVELHRVTQDWPTSPFLYDFAPIYLDGLDREDAEKLIRQEQRHPVRVTGEAIHRLHAYTGDHPYLLQWLCYHLYRPNHSLRLPQPEDVVLDAMLTSLFRQQFDQLAPTERRILLHLVDHPGRMEDVARALRMQPATLRTYLYVMTRLGYTRTTERGRITVGNHFLYRWLVEHFDTLSPEDATLSDGDVRQMAEAGLREEATYWQEQLRIYRERLGKLEVAAARYGDDPPPRLMQTIREHRRRIQSLERKIDAFHKTYH